MSAPETLGALQRWLREQLTEIGVDDPSGDARVLLSGLLGVQPVVLLLESQRALQAGEFDQVVAALERRKRREPVHRILGRREFYGLDLALSAATLEPRPDTEILVDHVFPHLQRVIERKGRAEVLDLGTGTGAILLALLSECAEAFGTAVDISAAALETATQNARATQVAERFRAVESDWFEKIEGRFDIIVSNPPYITTAVVAGLAPEVRDYDPAAALDGGADGLDAYRRIAEGAAAHLEEGGILGLEIGFDQKASVSALFEAAGFSCLEAAKDYGGQDRVLIFTR